MVVSTRRLVLSRRARLVAGLSTLLVALVAPLLVGPSSASAATLKSRTSYEVSIQNSVLKLINQQRAAHHLRAVTMNGRLQLSARRHDAAMAGANTMSHQVRGESVFSRRISAAGYNWSWAGENIAWNSTMTRAGVLTLQKLMYNERAPYDGHRRNILNRSFRNVGIDVYMDHAHHKVWLTTDFGALR